MSGSMSQVADLSPDRTELLPVRRVHLGPRTCLAPPDVLLLPDKAVLHVLGGRPARHVPACEGGAALVGHGSCGHVPARGKVPGAALEASACRVLHRHPVACRVQKQEGAAAP